MEEVLLFTDIIEKSFSGFRNIVISGIAVKVPKLVPEVSANMHTIDEVGILPQCDKQPIYHITDVFEKNIYLLRISGHFHIK